MDVYTEKFRPKTLSDIKGQPENLKIFNHFLKTKNIPNLLLYGPKGCGKTSSILAFCKDLYGPNYKRSVIELNASHDRGINAVRDKIKLLARLKNDTGVPYKMIILDEADSMTKDAMFALRMIMEDYSATTKFCLICNYPYKILSPIISRCVSMYFHPIKPDVLYSALTDISHIESQELKQIITQSNGDFRKCLLLYQYGLNSEDTVPEELITNLIIELKQNKFDTITNIYNSGYLPTQVLDKLLFKFLDDSTIKPENKKNIIGILAKCSKYIMTGGNMYIQYRAMCMEIIDIINK